ncbi:MAG: dipeptide epimerase [Chthoniobacter sp.]|nr:dipeptide epimerase [Chthoniobacter sp.]
MKLTSVCRELHPRHAFRISRGRRTEVRNVFVRLAHDGIAGYGEASPNAFYEETWEGVMEKIEAARGFVEALELQTVAGLEAAWGKIWELVAPSRAALCALDLAMWDWLARRRGVSVTKLLWDRAPKPITTFCTIGLSTPEELAEKLAEVATFPRIKIKSDAAASLTTLKQMRARSAALLAVDANCAWGATDLRALARELAALRVVFIEQPYPPARDAELPRVRAVLPLMADESCVVEEDVARGAPIYDGFNIKLVKCGGLTPARRMVLRGKALRKTMMVGCMLESSALIAAGAAVAQRTSYADLDGAWLLGDDPFRGWQFARGVLTPPDVPGLGVEPEPGLFES